MKKNKQILSNKLPSYEPKQKVWLSIEHKLDENKGQNILNHKLPIYEAPDFLWPKIEVKYKNKKTRTLQFNILKIAAGITIIIALGIGVNLDSIRNNTTISYSTEYETEITPVNLPEYETINKDFEQILTYNCKILPLICSDKKYLDLKQLRELLENEEDDLKTQFEIYKDPEIKNHLVQVLNEKQKVEKYMLSMFINY